MRKTVGIALWPLHRCVHPHTYMYTPTLTITLEVDCAERLIAITAELGRQRLEDHTFEAGWDYITEYCLKDCEGVLGGWLRRRNACGTGMRTWVRSPAPR